MGGAGIFGEDDHVELPGVFVPVSARHPAPAIASHRHFPGSGDRALGLPLCAVVRPADHASGLPGGCGEASNAAGWTAIVAVSGGRTEGGAAASATPGRLLRQRFGALPSAQEEQICRLSLTQTEALAKALLDFQAPADLAAWLEESETL